MKDELTITGVKTMTIVKLLEEYAHSTSEGELPSNKKQAWNIAQDLKKAVK